MTGLISLRRRVHLKNRIFIFALFLFMNSFQSVIASNELNKGIQLAKQGKFRDAIMVLRPGIDAQLPYAPENAANYYYQAYCYYQLHDLKGARTLFEIVLFKYAGSAEAKLASRFLQQINARDKPSATAGSPTEPIPNQAIPAAIPGASYHGASKPPEPEDTYETTSGLPNQGKFYYIPGEHGHMNVQAVINGRPINCWFDTGAPGLFFSSGQLKQLGIPLPQGPPTTYTSGWAGRKVPAWNMDLTVKLGSITRTLNATVQAGEYDLQPLIGYSFIQGYEYQIDQAGRCVYMKKSGGTAPEASLNSLYDIPCRIVQTKPIVPIEVNGKKVPVFVDTGSNSTNFDLPTIQSLGIQIPADAPVTMATGVGGSLAYRIIYVDLRMGPITKKEFPVQVGGAAGSCVGQDFLSGRRYTIDENKSLLRFFH